MPGVPEEAREDRRPAARGQPDAPRDDPSGRMDRADRSRAGQACKGKAPDSRGQASRQGQADKGQEK